MLYLPLCSLVPHYYLLYSTQWIVPEICTNTWLVNSLFFICFSCFRVTFWLLCCSKILVIIVRHCALSLFLFFLFSTGEKTSGLPRTQALSSRTGAACNEPPCRERPLSCGLTATIQWTLSLCGEEGAGQNQRHKREQRMYPLLLRNNHPLHTHCPLWIVQPP